MAGLGYYAGVGASGTVGSSKGPLPTVSYAGTVHAEANIGTGEAVGASGSISVRPGVGVGLMVGAGPGINSVLATPSINQMLDFIRGLFGEPNSTLTPCP